MQCVTFVTPTQKKKVFFLGIIHRIIRGIIHADYTCISQFYRSVKRKKLKPCCLLKTVNNN